LKGGHGEIDVECKFKPEVYSRREGEEYRDHEQLIADLYQHQERKNLRAQI
jgi:hypothetical protein